VRPGKDVRVFMQITGVGARESNPEPTDKASPSVRASECDLVQAHGFWSALSRLHGDRSFKHAKGREGAFKAVEVYGEEYGLRPPPHLQEQFTPYGQSVGPHWPLALRAYALHLDRSGCPCRDG
jgi:hypothetical protein